MSDPRSCLYCNDKIGWSSEYWIVKESVKPKGSYKRWKWVGYCCVTCELAGKPCVIETVT